MTRQNLKTMRRRPYLSTFLAVQCALPARYESGTRVGKSAYSGHAEHSENTTWDCISWVVMRFSFDNLENSTLAFEEMFVALFL